jgi:transposase
MKIKQTTREREALICDRTAVSNRLHACKHQGRSNTGSIKRAEEHIEFIDRQIVEIEKEIKEIIKNDAVLEKRLDYVLSIKGVGLITALTVVAETNGFASINNMKQLTGFAGLDVKVAESGKWKGKSRISKQGNSHIGKVLMFPALSMIRHNAETNQYDERLKDRKGVKMMAVVAVQRKLLGLIYTLWKKQEMFSDTVSGINGNKERKSTPGSE